MEDKHVVSASAIIPARRERVYSLIANYRDGHPRILPKQFSGLVVEQGGIGAGTVIRFQMSILGRTKNFRATITEPEPGRRLVESYMEPEGTVTTFIVDSGTAPADSRVTISTQMPVRQGLLGLLKRKLSTVLLQSIYKKELQILARVATGPFGA